LPGAFAATWTSGACNRGFVVAVELGPAGRVQIRVSIFAETTVDFLVVPMIDAETTIDFIYSPKAS